MRPQSTLVPTRFLESLDSIRFQNSYRYYEAYVLAELEVMLAMLFGERIRVTEAQSFDSRGFLEIAMRVLRSRPQIGEPNFEGLSTCVIESPFELVLRPNLGHRSYAGVLNHFFSRTPESFILTGWPELNENATMRVEFAEAFRQRKWLQLQKKFPNHAEQIEQVSIVDGEFPGGRYVSAIKPAVDLMDYVNLAKNTRIFDNMPNLPERYRKLPALLTALETKGNVNFRNRTDVRLKWQGHIDYDESQTVIEYVDSSYNRTVGSATNSTVGFFTTGDSALDPDVLWGEAMSHHVADFALGPTTLPSSIKMGMMQSNQTSASGLLSLVQTETFWSEIWRVVTDKPWQESVERLHRFGTDEALLQHCELLTSYLQSFRLKLTASQKNRVVSVTLAVIGALAGAAAGLAVDKSIAEVAAYVLQYGQVFEPTTKNFVDGVVGGAGGALIIEAAGAVARTGFGKNKDRNLKEAYSSALFEFGGPHLRGTGKGTI